MSLLHIENGPQSLPEAIRAPRDRTYNIYNCPRCKLMVFHKVGKTMGSCKVDGALVNDDWEKNPLTNPPNDCPDWKRGKSTFDKGKQNELRRQRDLGDKESG